jgi:hypothetical protein
VRPLPAYERTWKRRLVRWGFRFLIAIAPSRRVHGCWIGGVGTAGENRELLDKVGAAVALLALHDPVRLRRIRRDLKRILIYWLHGALGSYYQPLEMCLLDSDFITRPTTSPAMIAATIVHEATHARLDRWGFGYAESIRPRVERVCARAELAFAARIPDGQSVVAGAQAILAAPDTYWSDQEHARAEVKGLRNDLDRLALPKWLDRWLRRDLDRRGAA